MATFCSYLNKKIRPHNLVSISIFEDEHPNNKESKQRSEVNLSMLHKKDDLEMK
jgi:hypothetical protein